MGIKCPLQDMFKSLIAGASVVASALVISFSSPALAGSCDSIKEFAQEIEQVSGQKPIVECYEQELEPIPVQAPSQEGAEVFLSLAALLAGGWGLIAILNMSKSQPQDWDYGFSPTTTSSSHQVMEEEIFNPSDLNWEDESPIRWEDLSSIQWDDLI